jgi:hypothetical protein
VGRPKETGQIDEDVILAKALPKGDEREIGALHPDDRQKLENVILSKTRRYSLKPKKVANFGPTEERLEMARDAFVVGGEDRGTKIYFFADSPLQRLYARLRLRAGTRETEKLTHEYTALMKYRHHWYHAGLEAPLPSVDLGRVFASDPSNMVGMAKSERQADHRKKYREAVEEIGQKPHILLENFVCYEWQLNVSCHTIGYSMFRARRMVRDTAGKLAHFWGIG